MSCQLLDEVAGAGLLGEKRKHYNENIIKH